MTCRILYEEIPKSPLAEDIYALAEYTERFSPYITAAGFFRINKMLITSIISSLMTYLIVCIQFESSEFK